VSDWNDKIIAEFRANGGKVGGQFEGAPLLLLHSTGARSGQERVHPMMYQAVGSAYAVFASKAGAPDNPDWYHNLRAHPEALIEVGTETVPVTARILDPGVRRLRAQDLAGHPGRPARAALTTRPTASIDSAVMGSRTSCRWLAPASAIAWRCSASESRVTVATGAS
jgi:deazaflavin-dependent oxidoreductase (nitroreductase family)